MRQKKIHNTLQSNFCILRVAFCFFIAIMLIGCAPKEVREAYKHLRAARERTDPGVTYVKYDPEVVLREYEAAYQICDKEFESYDYKTMSDLYLEVRDDKENHYKFYGKYIEKAKEEGPSGKAFWASIFRL